MTARITAAPAAVMQTACKRSAQQQQHMGLQSKRLPPEGGRCCGGTTEHRASVRSSHGQRRRRRRRRCGDAAVARLPNGSRHRQARRLRRCSSAGRGGPQQPAVAARQRPRRAATIRIAHDAVGIGSTHSRRAALRLRSEQPCRTVHLPRHRHVFVRAQCRFHVQKEA
jgi:hypothetical protein